MLRAVSRAFWVGCVLVSVGRADAGESSVQPAEPDYTLLFDYSFTQQQLNEIENFTTTQATGADAVSLSISFDASDLWADDDLAFQTSDGTTFQLAILDQNTWSISIGQPLEVSEPARIETHYVDSGEWVQQQYGDLDATLGF